jgi:hypothetical protein
VSSSVSGSIPKCASLAVRGRRDDQFGTADRADLNPSLTTRIERDTRMLRATMSASKNNGKQNLTISLDKQIIRKAKIIAARRSTSVSGLLAHQIEVLVGEEEAYERAERQATALLDQGFHLGTVVRVSREELHER